MYFTADKAYELQLIDAPYQLHKNNVIIKGEGKGRSLLCTNSPQNVCLTDTETDTICLDQFF